jgi:phosphoribosylglycinamide formyltransferase
VDGRINGRVVVRAAASQTRGPALRQKGASQLLISDKAECGGVSFARAEGIPVLRYPAPKDDPSAGLSAPALLAALRDAGVQLVLLAGYLKLVPPELCRAFPRGVLNIHPALLPAFGGKGMYGARVHAAVLASGAWFSGPTVHFVDEEYDRGVILAQRCVPVLRGDTPEDLAHRVLEQEWRLYPAAVAAVCAGRVTWRDDGVPVIDAGISHDNQRSS